MNIIQNTFQVMLHTLRFVANKLTRSYATQSTWRQQLDLILSKYLPWRNVIGTKNKNTYRLKDQTCVELRLIGPQDRKRYLKGFSRISSRTNINRFHTFKTGFTENELSYLLDIDNMHHLAIGAINCKKNDLGIGLARYIRQADQPDRAEVAIIVIDEYQGRGLGKLLYHKLIDKALENGIVTLNNVVMKDNRAMLHILKQMGAQQVSETEQVYELELQLSNLSKASQKPSNKHHFQHSIKNASIMVI